MIKIISLYYKGVFIRSHRCKGKAKRLEELRIWKHLYGYKIWQSEVTITPTDTNIESKRMKYHEYLLTQQ